MLRERALVDVQEIQKQISEGNDKRDKSKIKLNEQMINDQMQKEINKQQKSITGGIPLDSLPLNWGK